VLFRSELRQLDTSNYYANWRTVISGVRAIYNGPLTYAANHDTYARISFWGLLDYAGIDAYFPLSNAQTPSVTDLVGGWSHYVWYDGTHNWTNEIETWQATVNKPVIFTEIGYRSIDYAAQDPGNWQITGVYNANGQANGYKAALQVFANKPWFTGMFWWSWYPDPTAGGAGNTDYTPQNKPAQGVLTAYGLPKLAAATNLSATAPQTASFNQNFTINGTLSSGTSGITDANITLQRSADNATWNNVTTTTTDATGNYQFSRNESAAGTYYYSTDYDGNDSYANATSNVVSVRVQPTIMPASSPAVCAQDASSLDL